MKWLRTMVVFDRGGVMSTDGWSHVHESYVRSINAIDFPEGSGKLTLRRKQRRPDGQWNRNGVGYLRRRFLDHMVNVERWTAEDSPSLCNDRLVAKLSLYPSKLPYEEPITSDFGGFDFTTTGPNDVRVAIEWETGNISSSHRSINKLAIALAAGKVDAGVLILPSRDLYNHLTDRIGNIGELSGYLSMWKGMESSVKRGLLAISVVEHDDLSDDEELPYLPSGNDGRAAQGRIRRI